MRGEPSRLGKPSTPRVESSSTVSEHGNCGLVTCSVGNASALINGRSSLSSPSSFYARRLRNPDRQDVVDAAGAAGGDAEVVEEGLHAEPVSTQSRVVHGFALDQRSAVDVSPPTSYR